MKDIELLEDLSNSTAPNKDGLRVAALRAARPAVTVVLFESDGECRHMPALV